MKNSAEDFLSSHNMYASAFDQDELVRVFTAEMISGLEGKEGALRMIPTYIEADNDFRTDTPVLAIDAGGTNFRAALVTITGRGRVEIRDTVRYRMPGLDGEITAKVFFSTLADYIKPLADKAESIGFCFSYPTEILPDRDGILLGFCKEVRAPEVVGQRVGSNLLKALGTPGKRIVLLNDTVATLLAGKSSFPGKTYDSYIGYILGTGTNTCYIEQNRNILKKPGLDQAGSQIINIESGDLNNPPRSELDMLFDRTTANPGSYKFEKMFSGGYFGGLALFVLKTAAEKGVFSDGFARAISEIKELPTGEVNVFLAGNITEGNNLDKCIRSDSDLECCRTITDTLTDRAARLVSASLSAVVLKCGRGLEPERPVLITVEGTTFYKLHNFRPRFEQYFSDYLSGDKKRYVEFTKVDNSSLIGAALAALTL